jgi:hypothetical protein
VEHPELVQIERYVKREADVDELVFLAKHLDECWDCREKAANYSESGRFDRRKLADAAVESDRGTTRYLLAAGLFVLAVILIAVYLLLQK